MNIKIRFRSNLLRTAGVNHWVFVTSGLWNETVWLISIQQLSHSAAFVWPSGWVVRQIWGWTMRGCTMLHINQTVISLLCLITIWTRQICAFVCSLLFFRSEAGCSGSSLKMEAAWSHMQQWSSVSFEYSTLNIPGTVFFLPCYLLLWPAECETAWTSVGLCTAA